MKNEVTKQIRVYGIVQGVGFRPTVSRHAATHQIRGSVSNKGPYVEIFAQGPEEAVDGFISDIENKPPKRAAILKMNIEPVEEAEDVTKYFAIPVGTLIVTDSFFTIMSHPFILSYLLLCFHKVSGKFLFFFYIIASIFLLYN